MTESAQFDKKFIQTRYFLGDDTNVFKFGSTTHKASINVSGRLGTGAYFQSDTLAGRGNNVPICTDGAGEIQFCP